MLNLLFVLTFCSSGESIPPEVNPPYFVRSDVNFDGRNNITDAILIVRALFGDGTAVDIIRKCPDAADTNDDGSVTIGDVYFLLSYLFLSGDKPGYPFPYLGLDPSEDQLTCNG